MNNLTIDWYKAGLNLRQQYLTRNNIDAYSMLRRIGSVEDYRNFVNGLFRIELPVIYFDNYLQHIILDFQKLLKDYLGIRTSSLHQFNNPMVFDGWALWLEQKDLKEFKESFHDFVGANI